MIPRDFHRALILGAIWIGGIPLQGASHPAPVQSNNGRVNVTATVLPTGANVEIGKVLTGNSDKDLTLYDHKLATQLPWPPTGEEEQVAGALFRVQETVDDAGEQPVLLLVEYLGN